MRHNCLITALGKQDNLIRLADDLKKIGLKNEYPDKITKKHIGIFIRLFEESFYYTMFRREYEVQHTFNIDNENEYKACVALCIYREYEPTVFYEGELVRAIRGDADLEIGDIRVVTRGNYIYGSIKIACINISPSGRDEGDYKDSPYDIRSFVKLTPSEIITHYKDKPEQKSTTMKAQFFAITGKPHHLDAIWMDLEELGYTEQGIFPASKHEHPDRNTIVAARTIHTTKEAFKELCRVSLNIAKGAAPNLFTLPQDYSKALEFAKAQLDDSLWKYVPKVGDWITDEQYGTGVVEKIEGNEIYAELGMSYKGYFHFNSIIGQRIRPATPEEIKESQILEVEGYESEIISRNGVGTFIKFGCLDLNEADLQTLKKVTKSVSFTIGKTIITENVVDKALSLIKKVS